MTFIALVGFDNGVLIAADRQVFSVSGAESRAMTDNAKKILRIGCGYVTASGFVELIDAVNCRLKSQESASIVEITDVIEQEQGIFLSRHTNAQIHALDWIQKTSWKFSISMGDRVIPAFYDFSSGGLQGLEPGNVMLTVPRDVSPEDKAIAETLVLRQIFNDPTPGSISDVAPAVMAGVRFLIDRGYPVSCDIDFAAHTPHELSEFSMNSG